MPNAFFSHRLLVDGAVEDLQQLGLIEDHLLAGHAGDLVVRRQLNRVAWARFLAHAAVDAAQLVDIKLLGVFLAVLPRRFLGENVTTVDGADGRTAHFLQV